MARRIQPRPTMEPEDLFWPKVDKNGPASDYRPDLGPCWLWTRNTYSGYGQFTLRTNGVKRNIQAHRFAYERLVGPIPEGLTLDHLCRVRNCVNPAHLDPCTRLENSFRGFLARDSCRKGHPYSGDNLHIRPNGLRVCRACTSETKRQYSYAHGRCSNCDRTWRRAEWRRHAAGPCLEYALKANIYHGIWGGLSIRERERVKRRRRGAA